MDSPDKEIKDTSEMLHIVIPGESGGKVFMKRNGVNIVLKIIKGLSHEILEFFRPVIGMPVTQVIGFPIKEVELAVMADNEINKAVHIAVNGLKLKTAYHGLALCQGRG